MPCRDYTCEDKSRWESNLKRDNIIKRLTVILCSSCRALEVFEYEFEMNPELDVWWADHKKEDENRKKEETKARLRKEKAITISEMAFKDLTKADMKLLKEEGFM
tara:strand:- start:2081 stop:2395 length:315 start_codon:yes stop_codon:yes gene_type:complete